MSRTDSYDDIKADNKLLAMKLKYLQSVTTIYRQRVAAITRDAVTGMGFGSDHDRKITNAIQEAESAAMSAMNQFEEQGTGEGDNRKGSPSRQQGSPSRAAQTKALLYGPAPTLTNTASEADFWRLQFLNLISEMRTVSVHDAEMLVNSLQDRKALTEEVVALRTAAASTKGILVNGRSTTPPPGPLADGTSPAPRKVKISTNVAPDLVSSPTPARRVPDGSAKSISTAPQIGMVLVSPSRIGATGSASPHRMADATTGSDGIGLLHPSTAPMTFEQAAQLLQEEQTKNKVQRVRLAALQKQMNAREEEFTRDIVAVRTENLRVVSAMKAIEEDRATLAQQNHDYRQQVYVSEKTVTLKESQLHRQQGRTTAVEKELQAATRRMQTVFDQEDDRRAAETAAIQQAFEENRKLQTEIQLLKANLEGARRQQEDTDSEVARLQIIFKSSNTINEQLRAEINKMEQAKLMSEWEADSMLSLLPRMDEATTELEQFFTFREVKIECERINGQLRNISSVCKSLLELNKVIEGRNNEIKLLRDECDRAVSLGVPPSITSIVDTQLVDGRKPRDREASNQPRPKPHVLLRQNGQWMEVRDTGTGRIVYITSEVNETPFSPAKIASAEEKAAKARAEAEAEAAQKAKEEEAKQKEDQRLAAEKAAKDEAERLRREAEVAVAEAKLREVETAEAKERKKKKRAEAPMDLSYRPRLIRIFAKYNPSKLNTVDVVMDAFRGRYDKMIAKLVAKYGPEPMDDGSPLPELPTQVTEAPSFGGSEAAKSQGGDQDDDEGSSPAFVKPLRDRLARLLAKYDTPKLEAVDTFINNWIEEGLAKLVSQYGLEPDTSEPAPELPQQLPINGDPAHSPHLQPHRRRLIRFLDKYDKDRLKTVDALIRQHPTPMQAETLLKKLAVKYGPEDEDAEDVRVPDLPEQISEVASPAAATTSAATSDTQPPAEVTPAPPVVAPADARPRLYRMFKRYAPEKLANIDVVLSSFEGEYELMFEKLRAKYGAEPEDDGEPMPDLPSQIVNPVVAARRRATSMRAPSAPTTLPAKKQPSGAAASPTRTTPVRSTPSSSTGTSKIGSSLVKPTVGPSTVAAPSAAVAKRPVVELSPSPEKKPIASVTPATTAPSPSKATPAAAPTTTATLPRKAPPAVAPTTTATVAAPTSEPQSPSPTSPRKAPPAAAIAAMNASKHAVAAGAAGPSVAPTTPRTGNTVAQPAKQAAPKGPDPAASPSSAPTQAPGNTSPRTAKAPPAAALAAMKARAQAPKPSINTDEI